MNISEVIVKNLELLGVEYAFGGSGAGIDDFVFALSRSSKIRGIIARHEQAASFMACGYAMFSDKLGVCFATPGPGAFNLISGLSVALSDSLPVLAISGYETTQGLGKGGLGETTGLNRTPNSQQVFGAITKKAFLIQHARQTCDILEEALNLAFEGRPGPVHIHLPFDIAHDEVKNDRDIEVRVKQVLAPPKQIVRLADEIERAVRGGKKVLVIAGYGCVRSHAEQELREFVDRFQIPFVTTMDAKGVVPENHPLCLGMMGASGDPGAKRAVAEADVVLALGNSFSKWQCWRWEESLFTNKTLLQINIDKAAINRVYPADVALVSDIKPALDAITRELGRRLGAQPTSKPAREKHRDMALEGNGLLVHPAALVKAISDELPAESLILGDAGAHMLWLGAYLELSRGQKYQNPGIFGPMAANVNSAIGVKCANPNRTVVVGCGDGGYQLAGFELMTAVEHKIPVVWIIFNNGEFGVIKMMQKRNYHYEAFNDFLNPDYVGYAKACGALGYRVDTVSEFAPAFREAVAANRPALIDVHLDPNVYPPFNLFGQGWKPISSPNQEAR